MMISAALACLAIACGHSETGTEVKGPAVTQGEAGDGRSHPTVPTIDAMQQPLDGCGEEGTGLAAKRRQLRALEACIKHLEHDIATNPSNSARARTMLIELEAMERRLGEEIWDLERKEPDSRGILFDGTCDINPLAKGCY